MEEKRNDCLRRVVLSDGCELVISLQALTWVEADEMVNLYFAARGQKTDNTPTAQQQLAELLSKVVGLSAEEVLALKVVDFAMVSRQVLMCICNPLGVETS